MSDEKETRPKRPTAAAKLQPEPVAEIVAEPAKALPAPEATAATLPATAAPRVQAGTDRFLDACHATLASFGASQTAIASDVTAMALEISGMARSNATAAGDSVTALMGAKSLVNAVEIQLGFARRSLDALVGGSTRLGEIGLRLASDATRPMIAPFSGR